jgi:hypothetical protein
MYVIYEFVAECDIIGNSYEYKQMMAAIKMVGSYA